MNLKLQYVLVLYADNFRRIYMYFKCDSYIVTINKSDLISYFYIFLSLPRVKLKFFPDFRRQFSK